MKTLLKKRQVDGHDACKLEIFTLGSAGPAYLTVEWAPNSDWSLSADLTFGLQTREDCAEIIAALEAVMRDLPGREAV